jgi:hypothetical protein
MATLDKRQTRYRIILRLKAQPRPCFLTGFDILTTLPFELRQSFDARTIVAGRRFRQVCQNDSHRLLPDRSEPSGRCWILDTSKSPAAF